MRSALKVELRRAFCNYGLVFSIGLGGILAILAFFTNGSWGLSRYWLSYMEGDPTAIADAVEMGIVDTPLEIWMPKDGSSGKFYYFWITILPLLCVLPYGVTYLQDKKRGLINQLIYRMGKRNYYFSKFIACFLSGGTVAVIPLIINLLLCMCFLPLGLPILSTHFYPIGKIHAFSEVFYSRPALYVLIYLGFTFLLFGLLTCLCMTLALVVENQFALMLTPFALYYALHTFSIVGLNRIEWSIMNNANLYLVNKDTLYVYIIELVVLFLLDICVMIKIKKDVI